MRPWIPLLSIAVLASSCGVISGTAAREVEKPELLREASSKAPAQLNLQIEPQEIALSLNQNQALVIVAHNIGERKIEQADLDILAVPGIDIIRDEAPHLPSAGDLTWRIRVNENERAPQSAKLVVKLRYSVRDGESHISIATFTINETPPPDITTSLRATITPSEISLDEYKHQNVRLQLQNLGHETVTVGNYKVLSPSEYVELVKSVEQTDVKPGETIPIELELGVSRDGIIPGSYAFVLGYSVALRSHPGTTETTAAQSKLILGIPGVTDVMQLLGVSSFLLLPGALSVIAFLAVFSRLTSARSLDWKDPSLVLIAVSLSFLYAGIYPFTVSQFFQSSAHGGYLRGYNVRDAAFLWIGSITLGAMGALFCGALLWFWSTWKDTLVQPSERDQPIDVLRKLAYHGQGFNLERLRKRPAGGSQEERVTLLLLPFGGTPDGQRWAIKRAVAKKSGPGGEGRTKAILGILSNTTSSRRLTFRLYGEIRRGILDNDLTLRWPDGGPQTINLSEYEERGEYDTILIYR